MIRTCRWISVVSGCVALTGLLLVPEEASAQRDSQQESRSLSAAIEEVRRSPFHRPSRAAWPAGAGIGGHLESGTLSLREWTGFSEVGQERLPEDTVAGLSTANVFLGTVGAAVLGDAAAYMLLLKGAYSPRESVVGTLIMVGGSMVAALGPAVGARMAGGRFLPGVLGSVVGMGLGGLAAGAIGDERGVPAVVLFSVFSLVHAGTTALFVMKAEDYSAAGRKGQAG